MTPAERKKAEAAGWTYDYTNTLKQEYAHRKTAAGVELIMSDKVHYKADEVKILNLAGVKIDAEIHAVKKVFAGVIVKKRIKEKELKPGEKPLF